MARVVLPQTNRMVLMVREYYLFKLYYIAGRPLPARNRLLKPFFPAFQATLKITSPALAGGSWAGEISGFLSDIRHNNMR